MSFPGAFGVNPTDDLKLYMRNVQLPLLKLPPNSPYLPQDSDHTHQNFLNVAFGDHRRLEQMQKLDGSLMSRAEDIRSYFNKIVTDGDVGAVERATDRPFSVPSKGFQVREPIRPPPVTARKFGEWVESGPLQTAQNMAHCIFSEMDDYMFLPEVDSVNGKIMDTFVWTTLPNKPGQHAFLHSKMSLTIFVQPPWILSPRDMLSFCELHSLPQDIDESKIASKHRLWATIYDQCIMRKCQYFVLTNYSNWVFGVFTAGFTKGYICASARFDSSDPTVIELLLYWIASAIRDEGAFVPPQIPEPVYDEPAAYIPPPDEQDEIASISTCFSQNMDDISEAGVKLPTETRVDSPPPDNGLLHSTERYWSTVRFTKSEEKYEDEGREPWSGVEDSQSSVGTGWSTVSATNPSVGQGHWITPGGTMKPIKRKYRAPPSPVLEETSNGKR